MYLTQTIFLFCSANFTLLQSLRRSRASSLYTREPFLVCANNVRNTLHTADGASPLPEGAFLFVRTLRECILLLARSTIGRPLFRHKSNTVGGHSICPRLQEILSRNPAANTPSFFQRFSRGCGGAFAKAPPPRPLRILSASPPRHPARTMSPGAASCGRRV